MREAAGYILFHGPPDRRRFLLLRNARHGTWAFPKGHLEPGEEPRAGARRELEEETGITTIHEVPGFGEVMEYTVARGRREGQAAPYRKRVRLFLAEAPTPSWTRSPEHDAGGWMTAEEVLATLTYEQLTRAFRRALAHLESTGR